MTSAATRAHRLVYNEPGWLDTVAAWLLALLWVLPLVYAVWTAFHPGEYSTRFALFAPLTLDNFARAWAAAPFARYFVNTALLVTMILACQLVLSTLAAYAFARYEFPAKKLLFALVLVQLMVMPDILLVENYKTMARLGLVDPLLRLPDPEVLGRDEQPNRTRMLREALAAWSAGETHQGMSGAFITHHARRVGQRRCDGASFGAGDRRAAPIGTVAREAHRVVERRTRTI